MKRLKKFENTKSTPSFEQKSSSGYDDKSVRFWVNLSFNNTSGQRHVQTDSFVAGRRSPFTIQTVISGGEKFQADQIFITLSTYRVLRAQKILKKSPTASCHLRLYVRIHVFPPSRLKHNTLLMKDSFFLVHTSGAIVHGIQI